MADAKIRLSVDGSSQVISEFSRVESKMGSLGSMADRVAKSLSVLGVGLGINEIARLSDEYTKYTAQLKLATTSETQYASARAEVSRIAKASQSDLANTGTLYARIANGTRELGVTQQKVGEITEAVTLSLKASGATQAESASATLQLSQAFAAGALRGEEFNAVNEASPRLMKALADGLGVPVGALKVMASEGKITSQVMAEMLPKALEDLRKEASQVETISGAMTNLKSSVMEMVGAQAQHNGTAALLSTTINTLANNLNYVTAAATGFTAVKVTEKIIDIVANTRASIIASNELAAAKARETAATIATAEASVAETSAKVAHLVETRAAVIAAREDAIAKLAVANASITAAQAQIQAATSAGALSGAIALLRQGEISLTAAMQARSVATTQLAVLGQQQAAVSAQVTAATAAQAAAQAGLSTATTAAAAGTGLLSRAVGFLGGPIGAVTTLLGLGVTAWMAWGSSSKDAEEKASASVEASTDEIIASLDTQIKKLNERNALAESGVAKLAQSESAAAQKLASLRAKMTDAQTGQGEYANVNEIARIDIVRKLSEQYGTLYGKIQAATEAQRTLDASGKAGTDLIEVRERLLGVNKQYLDDLTKLQTAREKGEIGEKEYIDLLGKLATKTYEASKAGKDATKAASDQGLSYDSLMRSIKEKIAVTELDITTQVKLTEGEKMLAKFQSDLVSIKNNLTTKQKQEITQALELLISKQKLNIETEKEIKLAADRKAAHETYIKGVDGSIEKINEEIAAEQEHIAKIGLTKTALNELDIARLESQIVAKTSAAADLMLAGSSEDLAERYLMEADQLRKLIALRRERFAKQEDYDQVQEEIKAASESSKRFAGELYQSVTDSLMRSFEKGNDIVSTFFTNLKNTAKTTVLKVGVQAVMTGVFGIGTMGQANAMQAMGQSGNDPISMISAGKSMYEGFASGFSGFGDSVAKYVQAGLDKAGLSMSGGGNSAFATGAGTAASYAGGAAVGIYGGRAISGGYSVTGGNAAVNVGTAIGAIWGPIGMAIGGAIGGLVNRAFGRKAAELQSSELSGTVGAGGFSASTRDVYVAKGGLFRSDKWSETNTAMTDTAGLTAQYEAIKAAATGYASMLGLSATAIDSYTKSFTFSLSKTGDAAKDAEANQKMLADLFVGISDDITKLVAPSIAALTKEGETASQTLGRLAMGLTSVNGVMAATGFAEFEKSLEGANAAQRLIDLSGGIETLASGAQYFFENFLTEAEKIKPSADRVTETMKRLGQSSVDTMEEFKLLVQGLDLATESGAKMYAELIAIAPQFKAVADYTKETVKASETYVDVQFNAQRKVEAAAIAATQALEAQARATMELAKAEKQKTYDEALQSRLRSGKIGEIMSSNYELNPVDFGKYVSAGQFDAAGFNSEILRKQAKLSLELIAKASADAINIEDVASVVGGLFDFTKGNEFRQILRQQLPQGTGLANDVGYVMFDFIESALEGIRLDKYAASGQGVINVINARDQIGYQADLLTQYNRSLSSAAEALRLGIVTQGEYTGAIAKANEILKDQVKTQDELAASLKQAGIDSIAFYFDQIGLSVERLSAATEKAAEPLAVVTSAIGRFTSISDVFSLSANAAGDVGGNADLVAQSAKIAAQVLTTQSAAQAAKELATKASFTGQSASQLRDISLLIEGVKQFDPNSFEAGFLRISDALNKGTIDQAQYQDLFSASMNMFNGVESESSLLAKTMGNLRASMSSFADSLLIDKYKTTLSSGAYMQEVMRQYDAAKVGAMTGDPSSISLVQSLGNQIASRENYSSRAEANYGFSRVLADAQMLGRYAEKDPSAPQVQAIKNLEKSISERLDKQFSIMRSQLLELQGARVEAARKNLPTGVSA